MATQLQEPRRDPLDQSGQATLRRIASAIDDAVGAAAEVKILFGSRARGDHRPDSDWDVLVILDDEGDLPKRKAAISSALAPLEEEIGTRISPLAIRWRDADDNAGVLRNVIREGRPLR